MWSNLRDFSRRNILLGQSAIHRRPVRPNTALGVLPPKVPSEIVRCVCEAYGNDREFIVRNQLCGVLQPNKSFQPAGPEEDELRWNVARDLVLQTGIGQISALQRG